MALADIQGIAAFQDILVNQDLVDILGLAFLDSVVIQDQAHLDTLDILAKLGHKVCLGIQDFQESVDILVLAFLEHQDILDLVVIQVQAHLDILDLVDILDQVYLDILDLVAQADILVPLGLKAHQVILDIQEFLELLAHKVHQDILDIQASVDTLDQE